MPTGKQAQNKPLISLTDGKQIGHVKDFYLDEKLNKVAAVFLGAEGLINRKRLAVARDAIQLMGIDAWLVKTTDAAVAPENIPDSATFLLLSDLRGREIVSEGGTQIGAVEDVIFDSDGDVLGFALGKIQVKGTLAERKAIARSAISTIGGRTAAMTANMAQAEATVVPTEITGEGGTA
jgi:uncharacterized protein YrrD